MAALPPRASLQGIPAELRGIIYEHVAADIDEVSIIGRKVGKLDVNDCPTHCERRMWHATAKHPLAQTCRIIRGEFSPIHRRRVIVEGVEKCYLELENYDVDCMGHFANLVTRVAPMLEGLREKQAIEKFIIRFLLNGHAMKSVKLLQNYSRTPGRLGRVYSQFRNVIPPGNNYWSWEVVLNLYDKSMSDSQKENALEHQQESLLRQLLTDPSEPSIVYERLNHRRHGQQKGFKLVQSCSRDDQNVATLLWNYHNKANAGFQAAKREMHRIEKEGKLREKLREQIKASMRKELKEELRQELEEEFQGREMSKQEWKQEVKDEIVQEMKQDIKLELKELSGDLVAQMRALMK